MYNIIVLKPAKGKKHPKTIKVYSGSLDDIWFNEEDKKELGISKSKK